MKLLSLSLIPIGCLFLAQLAQAQPEVDGQFLDQTQSETEVSLLGNSVGRIELHYSGAKAYERASMGRCIAVKRGKQTLDGLFFSHPTRCVVYSDRMCTKKVKLDPFVYKPGYYPPAVSKGYGSCHTIRS